MNDQPADNTTKTVAFVAVIAGVLSMYSLCSTPGAPSESYAEKTARLQREKVQAESVARLRQESRVAPLKISGFSWKAGGFGSVMIVSMSITNAGPSDLKDIELTCETSSNRGTQLNTLRHRVYEVFPAGKTIRVREASMGFIDNQSRTASCRVTDAVEMISR